MNKNIGIGILIVCFGFSNINVGWATDVVDVSPVIVQPYEIQALNQSMLARDRQNRDEEIEINNLIEENNKLIQTTLARQQDTGLQKVDQLMLNYRDALLSRDRERIASNGQRWWPSRYGDLIDLTVSVDDMKDIHRNLQSKSTLIEEKYQILNDLRDEMAVLNERLRGQGSQPNDAVIEGFKKIAQEQQDKIQMLVERLNEMDQKIAHFDEILAQKDRQIAQLRDNLARAQSEVSSQNELIKELSKQQKPIDYGKTSEVVGTSPIIVQPKVEEPQPQNAMAYSKPAEAVQIPPVETVETSPIIVQPNVTLPQQPKPMAYNPNTEIVQTPAIVVVPGDSTGKDETIRWLNKVLAAAKDKAEYFRLTAQQDNASLEELQAEVQKVKHDFALRFKDFNQYQRIIVSLKNQANQFNEQLTQKQQQVDFLKSDDRLALARQLIGLQHQEEGLLVEKGNLTMQQYMLFDRRLTRQKQQQMDALRAQLRAKIITEQNQEQVEQQVQDLKTQLQEGQNQIAKLKAQIQENADTQTQMPALKEQLAAQQDKVALLKTQLDNKTAESDKLTTMLNDYQNKLETKDNAYNEMIKQIADLNVQLKRREAQVVRIKQDMYAAQQQMMDKDKDVQAKELSLSMVQGKMDEKAEDIKALRQELALARQRLQGMPSTDEIDFWKSGLQKATAELKEKGQMLAQLQAAAGHYPEKLAIQTKAVQSLKAQLESVQQELSKSHGIVDDKTKEILRLKYLSKMAQQDWRKQVMELNRKLDAAQKKFGQKMYENRITALEKQIANLKARLQQKEAQKGEEVPENLSFPIEPEPQTDTFQILQEQLQNAQQELAQTKGELEDKTKEIVVLTHRLDIAEKKFNRKAYDNQMTALEAKFKDSLEKIKELQAQVNALEMQSKGDAVRAKLEQAVDKIQAQGRMINILSQKLEEAQSQNTGK